MTKQELDLLKLPARHVTEPSTGTAQIVRRQLHYSRLGRALSLTTHQTTFSVVPVPQTDPLLFTQRKTRPLDIPAIATQSSTADLTQFGTGTVRMCPPFPIRFTMAQ